MTAARNLRSSIFFFDFAAVNRPLASSARGGFLSLIFRSLSRMLLDKPSRAIIVKTSQHITILKGLVPPARLELATCRLRSGRSFQLSYGGTKLRTANLGSPSGWACLRG